MVEVTIEDAQVRFTELLTRVQNGEEIVIAREGKPVARLSAIVQSGDGNGHAENFPPRIAGLGRGEIKVSDDFDDPLPDSFWLGEE